MRALALPLLLLAGCASAPALPERVEVPVAVPCVASVPARPDLVTDAALRAMTDFQLVLALWRDRLQRAQYEAELQAVLAACVR
jgi:hypothetical protein